jgi:hypothetical protein
MSEPGLDLHEWESMWASVEEGEGADPDDALSQYADIVQRMLASRGYNVTDPVERTGDESEIVVTYLSAREVADHAQLGQASRDEVRAAIDDLRSVFETIVQERP